MDSHTSHYTLEFTLLARDNNVHIYAFPSHLTHILQPLNVRIFHPYKHWHKQAVYTAIWNLDLELGVRTNTIRLMSQLKSKSHESHVTLVF